MLVDPRSLSAGERLELSRRRSGLTQREAAELLGWPFKTYVRAEHGDVDVDAPPVLSLSAGEECYLARRRAGLTLSELEELSGYARRWVHRVERGQARDSGPLLEWWLRKTQSDR